MNNPKTEIALGIVVHEDKVLVIERRQREIGNSGKPIVWAFPGGKLEPGETGEQAAVREVAEETEYKVAAHQIITEEDHPEYPVHVYYIGCKLQGKAAISQLPDTIVHVDWTPAATIDQLFAWPINEKVRAYIQSQIT